MSTILDQRLITIKEAANSIPTRPHFATIWRWIERGCRGHKLQSWLVGGQRYTSLEAIETFLAAINGDSPKSASMTPKNREKAISQVEQELADMGI